MLVSRLLPFCAANFGRVHLVGVCTQTVSIRTYVVAPIAGRQTPPSPFNMLSYLNPIPQLPKYKGPYKVGSAEFEIPVSEIPSSTVVPDANIETIKFRVFYPTTASAKSYKSISWLPSPQKEWNRAYARFYGLGDRSSNLMANLPSMLNHTTIPAVQNAPVLEKSESSQWPVVVFSHGLGGNFNTYSAFVGSLASCGIVVVAPEHRDQSAPISFIRTSRGQPARPVLYRQYSHSPTVNTLNGRNAMLRIRMWELEKTFTAIACINSGKEFTNLADTVTDNMPIFRNILDLGPGRVTWAGHSFGAASMVQFVKSVYYQQYAPSQVEQDKDQEPEWDWTPLYTPDKTDSLTRQITADSPMALLDLWTMPLTNKTTNWLWERPMPCYDRKVDVSRSNNAPNVISVMSAQFFNWTQMVNRTKALLSTQPAEAFQMLQEQNNKQPTSVSNEEEGPEVDLSLSPVAELETAEGSIEEARERNSNASSIPTYLSPPSDASSRTPSPARSGTLSDLAQEDAATTTHSSPQSSIISIPVDLPSDLKTATRSPAPPRLYMVPNSAHLSQSDFGVLYPNLTKYIFKTGDPEETMDLNVRAVLAMMRGCGLDVSALNSDKNKKGNKAAAAVAEADNILEEGAIPKIERWQRLEIPVMGRL